MSLAASLDSPLSRGGGGSALSGSPIGGGSSVADDDDIDAISLTRGALYKRKDFLDVDEEAKLHPERTYYFRKVVDLDRVVDQCTRKLAENGRNVKALSARAGCLMKKKLYALAVDDYSSLLSLVGEDAPSLYSRGTSYDRLGQTNDAIVRASGVRGAARERESR